MGTQRAEWIRSRWKTWFRPALDTTGVSLNALSRALRGETGGDYRSALRAYQDGTVTITADRAFYVGDAIARLSPGSWISGFYAVAIAGYYEELMRVLEVVEQNRTDFVDGTSALAAIHLPFLAELELALLRNSLPLFVDIEETKSDRNINGYSMFLRAFNHAFRFATRASYIFTAVQDSTAEMAGEPSDKGLEELRSLARCWELRHATGRHRDPMDETVDDRPECHASRYAEPG